MKSMDVLERMFEGALWRSRYVVLFAVVASLAASMAIFYLASALALVGVTLYLTHASHGAAALPGETKADH